MTEFVMTCGISSSGKSTWAFKHEDKGYLVLDSDRIRGEIHNGDETCQDNNDKVFRLMFQRTQKALAAQQSVVYCACNLGMRYRIHLLKQLRHKFPNVMYRCVIFNTPLDLCREQNMMRKNRHVPDWLFMKQMKQFQCPVMEEGWDKIEVINRYKVEEDDCPEVYYVEIEGKVRNFGSQQNIHHSLSLWKHCLRCGEVAVNSSNDEDLIQAACIHDFGKAYTATRWAGEKDDGQLHYPNHAEVGAYLALNSGFSLEIVRLVNYHMVSYYDEKAKAVWRQRLGEELWSKIIALNVYDRAAH